MLDEVFGLLTLAHERDAELDQHGRPLPPADPPGPARGRARGRASGSSADGYPGGERFLVALTHDVDLLGGGGLPTAARKLAGSVAHRSRRRLLESTTFAADAVRGRDPDYPLAEMLAAEGARGSTCFFLTRQEAPQDGYPERYGPALARRARANARGRDRDRAARLLPRARAAGRDRGGGASRSATSRACATTTCAATRRGSPRSCGRRACATTRASAGPRCPACARGRRTRTGSGTPSGARPAPGSCRSS